jgi:hypothetical protein
VISAICFITEFLSHPLLQAALGEIEYIRVVGLHEEERGLVTVIADHQRLIFRGGGSLRVERMVRQYRAVNHRPKSAGATAASDTLPSAAHS